MNNTQILNELTAQATTELFGDYSFPVECAGLIDTPSEHPEIAGVISLFGNDITGTLALATSRALIDAIAQATPGVVSSADWLAELANQLLGRIKRLFAARSATVYLGTPVTVSGKELEFRTRADRATPTWTLFLTQGGQILVWSDMKFSDGFEFRPNADIDGGADAGDTILF